MTTRSLSTFTGSWLQRFSSSTVEGVSVAAFANPIEWQEMKHQERSIPAYMRRYWWLAPLLLALAVGGVASMLSEVTAPTRETALYVIWIVHALAVARALASGANAISREHVGLTWDTLVMTGVSARSILFGKWLGVLRHAAPWMLLLATVRLAMLPVFMLALVNRYAWRHSYGGYSGSGYYGTAYYGTSPYIDWVPWATLLAVALTVVLTVLELLACTALGLAASAVLRRGWLALMTAFCIRFAPVVFFAAFTYYEVGDSPSWRILRFPWLTLADGGTAPLYALALPLNSWTSGTHINAIPGALMSALLLLALLAGALLVTWHSIRSSGALPESSFQPPAKAIGAVGCWQKRRKILQFRQFHTILFPGACGGGCGGRGVAPPQDEC
jgi:hypothetical protein